MAQFCVREKGDWNCPSHIGHKVALECETCPGTLVCTQCVASIHKGHAFKDIEDSVTKKVKEIEEFIHDIDMKMVPEVVRKMEDMIKLIQINNEIFSNEIKKAKEHGEDLKKAIDRITTETVDTLEFLFQDNATMCTNYQLDLDKLIFELERKATDCRNALKSGNDVLILDTHLDFTDNPDLTIPLKPLLTFSTVARSGDSKSLIEDACGKIIHSDKTPAIYKISFEHDEAVTKLLRNSTNKSIRKAETSEKKAVRPSSMDKNQSLTEESNAQEKDKDRPSSLVKDQIKNFETLTSSSPNVRKSYDS